MKFDVELKPRALKDLGRLEKHELERLLAALDRLRDDLHGDVERLVNFTPECRLRVGRHRVLSEVEVRRRVVVYRVMDRREAYR